MLSPLNLFLFAALAVTRDACGERNVLANAKRSCIVQCVLVVYVFFVCFLFFLRNCFVFSHLLLTFSPWSLVFLIAWLLVWLCACVYCVYLPDLVGWLLACWLVCLLVTIHCVRVWLLFILGLVRITTTPTCILNTVFMAIKQGQGGSGCTGSSPRGSTLNGDARKIYRELRAVERAVARSCKGVRVSFAVCRWRVCSSCTTT